MFERKNKNKNSILLIFPLYNVNKTKLTLQNFLIMQKYEENNFKIKKLFLKFCVIAPFFLILLTIFFIYVVYQTFYIIPLMTGSYWYEISAIGSGSEVNFHQINEIGRRFLEIFSFNKAKSNQNSVSDDNFKKGFYIFIVEHYLLFWLLFSLIKTMKTDPGGLPPAESRWVQKTKEIYNKYRMKQRKKIMMLKRKNEQELTKPIKYIDYFEESSFEENKNDQGRQGDYSNSSICEIDLENEENFFSEQEEIVINIRTLEQVRKKEKLRFCQHCHCFKPLRTHHCQQCMKCVCKMDHHCQWLLNCIGFRNYKYFMNMLIYADLVLFFIAASFTTCVIDVSFNEVVDGLLIYIILISYVLSIVLFGLLFGFTIFHFWLILTAKTSLEYCEKWKKMEESEKNNVNDLIIFDEGFYKNFVNVFNKNPLFWFFPFGINEEGQGLFENFEIH